MKQIERAKPGPKPELGAGDGPQFGRTEAAKEAGMSPRQHKAAMNVGNIPDDQFEKMVIRLSKIQFENVALEVHDKRTL